MVPGAQNSQPVSGLGIGFEDGSFFYAGWTDAGSDKNRSQLQLLINDAQNNLGLGAQFYKANPNQQGKCASTIVSTEMH